MSPLIAFKVAGVVCIAAVASNVWADEEGGKWEGGVEEMLRGAIDPLFIGQERSLFLRAAGVDGELTLAKFRQDAARPARSFARPFDVWKIMLRFDKDSSSSIDWFEAKTYREWGRQHILERYDKNKSGRLDSEERQCLLDDLKHNPERLFGSAHDLPAKGSEQLRHSGPDPKEFAQSLGVDYHDVLKELGIDSDAVLSAEERNTFFAVAIRRMVEKKRAEREARSDEERAAAKRQQFTKYQQTLLAQFDANGDGRLDDDEYAVVIDSRLRILESLFDANGDGHLDTEEQVAMKESTFYAEFRARASHKIDLLGPGEDIEAMAVYRREVLADFHEQFRQQQEETRRELRARGYHIIEVYENRTGFTDE